MACKGFPGGASGKEPTCQCGKGMKLGFDPWFGRIPKESMASHSSILAWRIPWTEEPGGLQSIGSQRVRHDWSDLARTHAWPAKLIKLTIWSFMGKLCQPLFHVHWGFAFAQWCAARRWTCLGQRTSVIKQLGRGGPGEAWKAFKGALAIVIGCLQIKLLFACSQVFHAFFK